MKKWRTAVSLIVIAACMPGILLAARQLPQDNQALVEKKYAGWSGVLRIWAFEGWTGGDRMAGWINGCAAAFEKSHPGVYIEVTYPGAEAVQQLGRTGVRAPDMILFPPGLMDSAAGLAAIGEIPIRESLLSSGGGFACPVAMGGYAWAVNDAAEGTAIPTDEEWRSWSRAVEALGDPAAIIEDIEIEPPGIDLGLPASASGADALTRFTGGELNAVPVTQLELARLERLRDQGRGPEWQLQTGAAAWTDQLMYLSIVEGGQEALSKEFLMHLLSEECQARLEKVNLFGVTDAAPTYAPGSAMELLAISLLRQGFTAADAFNTLSEP